MSDVTDTDLHRVTVEEMERDPYPIYKTLRESGPCTEIPHLGGYLITRWEDIQTICRAPGVTMSPSPHPTESRVFGEVNILNASGAEHKDLRASIDPPLRMGSVNTYIEDLARPVARTYLEALRGNGSANITTEYLEKVGVRVLANLLGLRSVDDATLQRWFYGLAEGDGNYALDPAVFEKSDRIRAEIAEVVGPQLDELERTPDGSLLSHLLYGGRAEGDVRARDRVHGVLDIVLLGGSQEPGHGAGSTLVGLLENPDQLAAVVADSALIPAAILEGLRWVSPIGTLQRRFAKDHRLHGVDIPAGAFGQFVVASANRDERRFQNPDHFNISRAERGQHMAFGQAPHFCSGHAFARALERIMLEEVLTLPNLRLNPDLGYQMFGWVFRAPRELHVVWDN